jgi:hypothetical protein
MSTDPITIRPPCPSKAGGEVPRPPIWLLVALFLLALASTSAFLREPGKIDRFCREQFDVVTIVRAADAATPPAIARWWYGPWIQEEMPYYRPLTSMLFLAERRLFGDRWLLYSLVSWPLHALNTVLLALLVYRLLSGTPRRRTALGLLAAVLFTVPYWGNQGTAMRMLYWWPSQGDMLSLGFSLAALLAWDRVASLPRSVLGARCSVAAAMFLMLLAILSKEMAYVLPGLLLLLSLHRRMHRAPRTAHRALILLPFAVAGVLWLLRRAFVPEAMGFKWKGLYSLEKLYYHLGGPLGPMALVGDWALPVAAAGAALLLWGFGRRGQLPAGAALAVVWAALAFEWLGTSWARLLLAPNPWFLTRGVAYWLALGCLWQGTRAKRGCRGEPPVLFALGALFLIHLPLLHHGGVHYYYWPSAAWAIVNTVVVASLPRLALRGYDPRSFQ